MPASQAPDDLYRVESGYGPVLYTFLQKIYSFIILLATVNRNHNSCICNIKIGIGNRKPLILVIHRLRHRYFHNIELLSVGKSEFLESPQIFRERFVIGIRFIAFNNSDHGVFIYKPGEVVNMTVGIVTFYSLAKPKNLISAIK